MSSKHEMAMNDPVVLRQRHLSMAVWSAPLLILVATAIGIPFVALQHFTIIEGVITTLVAEVAVVMMALRYTGHQSDWKSFLRLKKFPIKGIVLGFVIGVLLFVALQGFAIILGHFGISLESSNTSTSLGSISSPIARVLIFYILTPFVIPFVEEVVFRSLIVGMAQNGTKNKKRGTILGVVLASAFFGLAHAQGFSTPTDFFIILWTAFIGCINALILLRYDSVFASYSVHLAYNGATVLVTVLAAMS